MAIDLPPGIEPALTSIQEMHSARLAGSGQQLPAIETTVADYNVIVYGNTQLPERNVIAALNAGNNLSDAVWHLHNAYMASGHRLTRLRYVLDDNQLHIRILEGQISSIQGPASLTRYFWEVEGKRFDLPKLETRRLLANLQSSREGSNTKSIYAPEQADSENIRLTLETEPNPEHQPRRYHLEIGNPGNRFVGRNFLLADTTIDSKNAQWKFSLNKSLNASNNTHVKGGKFTGLQIAANSITPIGLLGFGIARSDYQYANRQNQRFKARTTQAQLVLQEIAYTDTSQRNILSQKITFTDSSSHQLGNITPFLDERYFAADIGLEHMRRVDLTNYKVNLKVSADIRKGLSDESGSFRAQQAGLNRNPGFLSFMPAANISFTPVENWTLEIDLKSLFSDSQLPEQEQWVLGGPKQLRSKLPGSLLGDTGHFLNIELFAHEYNLWSKVVAKPSIFFEIGSSRLKKVAPEFADTQQVYDAGLALALNLTSGWTLNIAAAEVISEKLLNTANSGDADFYFSLALDW